jgi:hypothetical protein
VASQLDRIGHPVSLASRAVPERDGFRGAASVGAVSASSAARHSMDARLAQLLGSAAEARQRFEGVAT